MDYAEATKHDIPRELLLEADPSEARIDAYLHDAWCFVARQDGRLAGACIVATNAANTVEVFNIAVYPDFQRQGIGAGLLKYVLEQLQSRGVPRVELGTGAFGHQLAFYQRLGFRVGEVWKNHFLDHYDEPVMENGLQHKDMLRLYLEF